MPTVTIPLHLFHELTGARLKVLAHLIDLLPPNEWKTLPLHEITAVTGTKKTEVSKYISDFVARGYLDRTYVSEPDRPYVQSLFWKGFPDA